MPTPGEGSLWGRQWRSVWAGSDRTEWGPTGDRVRDYHKVEEASRLSWGGGTSVFWVLLQCGVPGPARALAAHPSYTRTRVWP